MERQLQTKGLRKIGCAFVIFCITYTIVLKQTRFPSDYQIHMNNAMNLYSGNIWEYSYPLWHLGLKILYKILNWIIGIPAEYVTALWCGGINVGAFLVVDKIIGGSGNEKTEILSLLTLIVGPFYAPWFNSFYFYGQGSPNVWHNPTNIMVRPFALIAFALLCGIIAKVEKNEAIQKREYWGLTGILFVATLAKPSFIQSMIPTLGVYLFIACIAHKFKIVKKSILICLCFIPSVLVMLYQFFYSFFVEKGGAGIGIGWLEVFSQQSPNIFISGLLVLVFPLLYTIMNFRKLLCNCDLRLAWLNLGVAWLEGATLYENGQRKLHGNFGWAYVLAFSILWVISVKNFYKDWQEIKSVAAVRKNLFLAIVFGAHVVFGGYYIYTLITVPKLLL